MVASVNKVILIGNIGRDPEISFTPAGAAVASLSLATSSSWKDKATGEWKEDTEWHRLVAYDRQAEYIGKNLKKGEKVYVEGRLKTRKWTDKSGNERYTTEIVIATINKVNGKANGEGNDEGSSSASAPPKPAAAPSSAPREAKAAPKSTGFDDMDDDIPF